MDNPYWRLVSLRLPALGLLMAPPTAAHEVVEVKGQLRVVLQWHDVMYLGGYGNRSFVLPYAFLAEVVISLEHLHPQPPPRGAMVEALLLQRFMGIVFFGGHIFLNAAGGTAQRTPYRTALYAVPFLW